VSEATVLFDSLIGVLSAISRDYGERAAASLQEELALKFSVKSEEIVNGVADAEKATESSKQTVSYQEPRVAINDTGLVARDVPERHKTHRQLRKALIENVMLTFFARNPAGVVTSDVTKELARLGLSEPAGTMRGRISGMRKGGLLSVDAGFGNYVITKSGHSLAKKAIIKYGFQIQLPEPPEPSPTETPAG
jgi:hypothetical protein